MSLYVYGHSLENHLSAYYLPSIWDIKRAKVLKARVLDLTELAIHLSLISLKTEVEVAGLVAHVVGVLCF